MSDAVYLVSYSGLGRTASGMQISEWMSNVFSGRNLNVDGTLNTLCHAMTEQFQKLCGSQSNNLIRGHQMIIVAFVNKEPKTFVIRLLPNLEGVLNFQWTEIVPASKTEGFFLTTGSQIGLPVEIIEDAALARGWYANRAAELLKAVQNVGQEAEAYLRVADQFAAFNYDLSTRNPLIGPNCSVVWRSASGDTRNCYYDHGKRSSGISYHAVFNGLNMSKLTSTLIPLIDDLENNKTMSEEEKSMKINDELKKLDHRPDENLN